MPKSPLPPGSSNPPQGKFKLDETLSTSAAKLTQERGRRTLSTELAAITAEEEAAFAAKQGLAEVVELRDSSEVQLEEEERTSISDPEAARDLQEGVGVFREAVDTITSSLLLIIGQFEEQVEHSAKLSSKIASNNRVSRLNSLLSLVLILGVGYAVWQMRDITQQSQADLEERKLVTAELIKVRDDLKAMKVVTDDTKKAVAKAEADAAEKPTVEIVPDNKGGAKVVIRAPKNPKHTKNFKHPPPSGKPAPPTAVEIPLKLPPGAKTQRPPFPPQ